MIADIPRRICLCPGLTAIKRPTDDFLFLLNAGSRKSTPLDRPLIARYPRIGFPGGALVHLSCKWIFRETGSTGGAGDKKGDARLDVPLAHDDGLNRLPADSIDFALLLTIR